MKRDATFAEQFRQKLFGFTTKWVSMLWSAMFRTGRGYRKASTRRDLKIDGRRHDKRDGTPKRFRQYRDRYHSVPMKSARERA